jgi:hypothetical protein
MFETKHPEGRMMKKISLFFLLLFFSRIAFAQEFQGNPDLDVTKNDGAPPVSAQLSQSPVQGTGMDGQQDMKEMKQTDKIDSAPAQKQPQKKPDIMTQAMKILGQIKKTNQELYANDERIKLWGFELLQTKEHRGYRRRLLMRQEDNFLKMDKLRDRKTLAR